MNVLRFLFKGGHGYSILLTIIFIFLFIINPAFGIINNYLLYTYHSIYEYEPELCKVYDQEPVTQNNENDAEQTLNITNILYNEPQDQAEREYQQIKQTRTFQIFDFFRKQEFLKPYELEQKKVFVFDLIIVKTPLVKNLLTRAVSTTELKDKINGLEGNHVLKDTEVLIGKYLYHNILSSYSLQLKESYLALDKIYYEHQLGIDTDITENLRFEYKYFYYNLYSFDDLHSQHKYMFTWSKTLSI